MHKETNTHSPTSNLSVSPLTMSENCEVKGQHALTNENLSKLMPVVNAVKTTNSIRNGAYKQRARHIKKHLVSMSVDVSKRNSPMSGYESVQQAPNNLF